MTPSFDSEDTGGTIIAYASATKSSQSTAYDPYHTFSSATTSTPLPAISPVEEEEAGG